MTNKKDNISKEYSKAVESDSNSIVSKTKNAKFADYSDADLSKLPEDIQDNSFGCGNPLAFSEVQLGEVVLDLGCGAGLDLLIASERVGVTGQVIGVDYNDDMLTLAKNRTENFTNIQLRKGKIEDLPVDSKSVDWVISNCVINLSNEKQRAFNEISRVLKPNGKMIVSDIVAENLPWWVRRSGILRAACGGGVISEKQYLDGLSSAGLEYGQVVDRQYYEAYQLASIVSEAAPTMLRKIRCCGINILDSLLRKMAEPISKNLWSAKISASASKV